MLAIKVNGGGSPAHGNHSNILMGSKHMSVIEVFAPNQARIKFSAKQI